MEHTHRFR